MKGKFLRKERVGLICCICIIGACLWQTAIREKSAQVMLPVERKTIVLDAGHGGWDPGKTGSTQYADEKDLNLAVVEKLQHYLEQGGATVLLTRNTDDALGGGKREDMAQRKKIANEYDGDILVSIHQNAFPSPKVKGAQVFYHQNSPKAKALAESVQESLRQRVDESNGRQAKENKEYYILRATEIPAIIVECGFLSNREEEALLNDSDYQDKLAWAVYCGILEYFTEQTGEQV